MKILNTQLSYFRYLIGISQCYIYFFFSYHKINNTLFVSEVAFLYMYVKFEFFSFIFVVLGGHYNSTYVVVLAPMYSILFDIGNKIITIYCIWKKVHITAERLNMLNFLLNLSNWVFQKIWDFNSFLSCI